jgi:hypothetical protein
MRLLRILLVASTATALMATPALAEKSTYNITLSGAEEVPGPGDPDGTGTAVVTLDTATNELCWDIKVQNIGDPTAGHIHVGDAGKSGSVIVDLNLPANGLKACTAVDGKTMGHLSGGPKSHYLNIHTAEFPNGAVRGQLQR